jgi:hypothetical protein
MRRLALSVFTACGLAILSACSGGTGFQTGTGSDSTVPTQLSFTGSSAGQSNDFFLAPTPTAPLSITAIAQKGSGPTVIVVPNVSFQWAARFVNPATDPASVSQYLTGPTPSGYKTCATPASTPAVPIYYNAPGSVTPSVLPAGQASQQIFIEPVAGVAAPYCLVVQATAFPGAVIGTVTVVVSNSP